MVATNCRHRSFITLVSPGCSCVPSRRLYRQNLIRPATETNACLFHQNQICMYGPPLTRSRRCITNPAAYFTLINVVVDWPSTTVLCCNRFNG